MILFFIAGSSDVSYLYFRSMSRKISLFFSKLRKYPTLSLNKQKFLGLRELSVYMGVYFFMGIIILSCPSTHISMRSSTISVRFMNRGSVKFNFSRFFCVLSVTFPELVKIILRSKMVLPRSKRSKMLFT